MAVLSPNNIFWGYCWTTQTHFWCVLPTIRLHTRWDPKPTEKGWFLAHITFRPAPFLPPAKTLFICLSQLWGYLVTGSRKVVKTLLLFRAVWELAFGPQVCNKEQRRSDKAAKINLLLFGMRWGAGAVYASCQLWVLSQHLPKQPAFTGLAFTTFSISAQKWAILLQPRRCNVNILYKNIWEILEANVTVTKRLLEERSFLPVLGRRGKSDNSRHVPNVLGS